MGICAEGETGSVGQPTDSILRGNDYNRTAIYQFEHSFSSKVNPQSKILNNKKSPQKLGGLYNKVLI
jgi:hypothetical protein